MVDAFALSAIRELEEGLFANRPCLKTVIDRDWVWRFANGYTGRANSLQSLSIDDHGDCENRLACHWKRSREYGIDPRFRVTSLTPPRVIEALKKQRFVAKDHTLVMVAELAEKIVLPISELKMQVSNVSDANWQREIIRLEKLDARDVKTFVSLLNELPQNSLGLSVGKTNSPAIGAAYASCVGTLGSVFAVIVAPKHRGKGIGRMLMQHLLSWLGGNGAKKVALQVVADNQPAVGLYHSFGFESAYEYHYLVEG